MARKFKELTKGFSKKRRGRVDAKKEVLRKEMELAELRQALLLTQSTLAENLGVGQAEVSKIESRTDMFVSTLGRFIKAMGGTLEIRAVFPDRAIIIKDFSSLAQKQPESEKYEEESSRVQK